MVCREPLALCLGVESVYEAAAGNHIGHDSVAFVAGEVISLTGVKPACLGRKK